jgi:tRNA(Ile)-lysidine synthase
MRKSAGEPGSVNGRFSQSLAALGHSPNQPAAVAVSGGGDSLALMYLMAEWTARHRSLPPAVLTVDHGLRPESAEESLKVKAWAESAGLTAAILKWDGAKPSTGIEQRARVARYRLMGEWCVRAGINCLLIAHTSDDLAENFLLRLGHGSGLDGLAAMAARGPLPVKAYHTLQLIRPLLDFSRAELRAYLQRRGAAWLEDSMNTDETFARARARKLIPVLQSAGISPSRIVAASHHLARARLALDAATDDFLASRARFHRDGAAVDITALATLPREIALRSLAKVLMRVAARDYRPRFQPFERLFDAAMAPDFRRLTLGGCCISRANKAQAAFGPQTIWITRESPRKSRRQLEKAVGHRAEAKPKSAVP